MKWIGSICALLVFGFLNSTLVAAQTAKEGNPASSATPDAVVRRNIEAYLRNLYAWGPDVKLTVGPLENSEVSGLMVTTADVVLGEQRDSAKIYVSRDGKYMVRGEVSDLNKDPLAEARAKMKLQDAPSKGDPKATVTLVEYADFECPVCKQLHDVLKAVLPNYPQARLVFKDFPLSTIHPWARTAALAGRCAYNQDPRAFWKLYDAIYDGQELISPENAWDKMTDYATQARLNLETFKACIASPEAAQAVDESSENARLLEIASTPTIFVNGRRINGADRGTLEQYIGYELDRNKSNARDAKH